MKKQRIAAAILAGVMVLSLTACGTDKTKSYSKYVKLGEYKGIEYTKDVAEVTDDDVQSRLDSFVNGLTEKNEVKEGTVKDGDVVNIDFVGTKDGEKFDGGEAEGYELTIGSHSFIDGFEDGLIGKNIGEEVSLDLTFPEDYQNSDLAGAAVNFAVTINSVIESTTPKLTDALVKDNTEYDTIDAYKEALRAEISADNEKQAEQSAQQSVFDKVVENCEITGYEESEVKKLVDEEFENFQKQADNYGYSLEDMMKMYGYNSEDELKEGINEYVKNYLKQKMVMYAIAKKEGIKVTKEESEEKLNEYMENYGIKTKEEAYEYYGEEFFEVSILSGKVMDFLMENAKLVDHIDETEDTTAETTEEAADATEESAE